MAEHSTTLSTQQRLLEAAGAVFAEVGFRDATVRDICSRAGVNIAAVNYHFRDKDGLYAAVLASAHDSASKSHPYDEGQRGASTPQERLAGFVLTFMNRLFDEGRPAWQPRLMAREMIEPTGALDEVVERSIRPHFVLLSSIIRDLLGPAATDEVVALCGASVVGQCLLYHHCRPVVNRLFPEYGYTAEWTRKRAEHIAAFSLGGIAGVRAAHEAGGA